MKGKILAAITGVIAAGLVLAGTVAASDNKNDAFRVNKTLKETEVIDGSYYATGDTVTIAGTVKGDVYCMGQNVIVTGTVDGDVICAGVNIRVSGTIAGNVRLAGQSVTLDGTVAKSASLFASAIDVTKSSKVGQDLNGAGSTIHLDGEVVRDVVLGGSQITVVGTVGRNGEIAAEALSINDGASIGGTVRYTGPVEASVAEGSVKGGVEFTRQTDNEAQNNAEWWSSMAYAALAFLLLSLVLVLVAPQFMNNLGALGRKRVGVVIVAGLLLIIASPLVALLAAVTVVGIPLAIVLGLVWILLLLVSGPVAAYYLGRMLVGKYSTNAVASMMAGALVLAILYMIPVVNIIAGTASTILGVGMIGTYFITSSTSKKFSYSVK